MRRRERASIDRIDFAMSVVETRILERSLITAAQLETLRTEQDTDAIASILVKSGYTPIAGKRLSGANFDDLLRESLVKFAAQIASISPDPAFLDLFFIEYDIFNIQSVLLADRTPDGVAAHLIPIPSERAARYPLLASGEEQPAPDHGYDTLFYEARDALDENGPKAMQALLDRRLFARMLAYAKSSGIALFWQYAQAKIDFYNLMVMLRMRRVAEHQDRGPEREQVLRILYSILVPGGIIAPSTVLEMFDMESASLFLTLDGTEYRAFLCPAVHALRNGQDLSHIERSMDNYLTHLIRKEQFTALGPEALLGYFHARRIEAVNLRLILTTLFLGTPAFILEERLRDSYA